ncbi:hypothetical protein WJX64_00325 [Leifsonia sp. YIM 134122]|uniref:Uncharacterized protein n=1 Tax=Leifsonia stereocauli TaxID=3134136 RepID=A0ABU9VZ12_9MICO
MTGAASVRRGSDRIELEPAVRGAAVCMVVIGGIASFVLSGAVISLVRDVLHISCGIGLPGSEGDGTWMCADGIGYFGVAVVLGAMLAFVILAGVLIAGLVRPGGAASVVLVVLAAAVTAWILAWTWYGSSELVWAVPPGTFSVDYWYATVLPAATASAAAFMVALLGTLTNGVLSRVLLATASAGLLVATALQPALAVNTLAGAGLLAAAAIRSPIANARLTRYEGAMGSNPL